MAKTAQKRTESGSDRSKGDVTGDRLLEICLKQFQAKGFDGTTMRGLAQAAGLSLGAFYYHFPSKEAVVQVFYEKTFEEFAAKCREIFAGEKTFRVRLEMTLEARLETFASNRELLIVLSRAAVDPRSELSPFGEATKEIRENTIALFREMLEGSDFKCDKKLMPYMPTLLWMYMMGMIFFWVFDESAKQSRTRDLIGLLTPQLIRLIGLSRFPLTGSVMNPLLHTLKVMLPKAGT
jgi:AcrR family transcriptional regulator